MPAAIRRMTKIGAELDEDDGIARFNWLYLQVTTEVQRRLDEKTYFRDNCFPPPSTSPSPIGTSTLSGPGPGNASRASPT